MALGRRESLGAAGRAEALCTEIDAGQGYPESWIADRVLGAGGWRDEGEVIPGDALVRGLGVLVERVTAGQRVTVEECGLGLSLPELMVRWRISRATLGRLRALGLPLRRVVGADGRERGHVTLAAAQAFEQRHAERLAPAGGYSRLTAAQRTSVRRRGARYRRCLNLSLNAAAARLAQRFGRSRETMRQVLTDAKDGAVYPASAARRPRPEVVERALRMGMDASRLARVCRRSPAAIRRDANLARARRLAGVAGYLRASVGDAKWKKSALEARPAREGLGSPGVTTLGAFIALAREVPPPIAVEERNRLAAALAARGAALELIEQVDRLHPQAGLLDEIETMLRWASRLKAALLRVELRLIMRTVELRLGCPLAELPPGGPRRLVREVMSAAGHAIDGMDPGRTGRVAGAVGLAVDRCASKWSRARPPHRPASHATPVLTPEEPVDDWTRRLDPWQAALELGERLEAAVRRHAGKGDEGAHLLALRYGLIGAAPLTLAQAAEVKGLTLRGARLLEERARRSLVTP